MKYIIGVDGGGTKTEAAAYNLGDKQIGYGVSGSGNLLLNFDKASENILDAINRCIQSVLSNPLYDQCVGIYLGISGIEAGNNQQKIMRFLLDKLDCKIISYHDSKLAHAAIFKGKDGIVTISGTGSVCYGQYKGKTAKTGGWGHILGDGGSGYHIGLAAFVTMTVDEDLGRPISQLTRMLLQQLKLRQTKDIMEYIYSADKEDIAAFAPIVIDCGELMDENALQILKEAGEQLAIITTRLHKKLQINEAIEIGVAGSILKNNRIVRNAFKESMERELRSVKIIRKDIPATIGACYLHRRLEEEK